MPIPDSPSLNYSPENLNGIQPCVDCCVRTRAEQRFLGEIGAELCLNQPESDNSALKLPEYPPLPSAVCFQKSQNPPTTQMPQDVCALVGIHLRKQKCCLKKGTTSHHGEIVLLCNQEIAGFYQNYLDAYTAATEKQYPPGSFLLRACLRLEEEIRPIFRSRVAAG